MLNDLKRAVCKANRELFNLGLVKFDWGNVSAFDPSMGLLVVKPHGVACADLQPELMVIVSLDGQKVEGRLEPSADVMTHVALYSAWPMSVGAIARTHSCMATAFAQAGMSLAVYGASHADMFCDEVPVTRELMEEECRKETYRANVAKVITEKIADPNKNSAVLVRNSGPFAWGKDCSEAVRNIAVLEDVATMAYHTKVLNPDAKPMNEYHAKVRYDLRH